MAKHIDHIFEWNPLGHAHRERMAKPVRAA